MASHEDWRLLADTPDRNQCRNCHIGPHIKILAGPPSVSVRQLSLNMGIMNLLGPFIGGIPLCHGAGGLAGQYYFGARTRPGANIIEGSLEMLGIFLSGSIASIFRSFPMAIVGAMMIMVGIELAKFLESVRSSRDWAVIAATVAGSMYFNMAAGFAAGLAVSWIIGRLQRAGV